MIVDTKEKLNVLITGAAGFLAVHVIQHFLRKTNFNIIAIDKLDITTKGWSRLKESDVYYSSRVKCFTWDLTNKLSAGMIQEMGDVNIIINLAAQTHIDESIRNPVDTIHNNIDLMINVLEYARKLKDLRVLVSWGTDEAYGTSINKPEGFDEESSFRPTNPYSGSKAATECLAMGYENTYGLPLLHLNCMNLIGEFQHVEKFIPLVIRRVLNGQNVDIHCAKDIETSGSRYYIHCRTAAAAILHMFEHCQVGDRYFITGEQEITNMDLAQRIAQIVGKELKYTKIDAVTARFGHDLEYNLNGQKLFKTGFEMPVNFEESLNQTVKWYLRNPKWLED